MGLGYRGLEIKMTDQIEQNRARNILLRSLMSVPHRDYDKLVPQFREAINEDPDFMARACVYLAMGNTSIRDHEDIAIITLLQSHAHFSEFRDAGFVLLLNIAPFRIIRVLDYISRSDRKVPRLTKIIATQFVQTLEAEPARFDGVAVGNFRNLKNVYRHYHIKPNDRAQAILFDNNPPEDSKSSILKQIAASTDPTEQAKLVIEHKIPYRIASTVMPKNSPEVGVALIAAMSPTEALNSRSWIEKSGLLEIDEVKVMYVDKITRATKSVASAEHRESAQGEDAEVQAAVETAKQTAIEQSQIESNIMLLIDRSSSMDNAIRTAIEFGARIAPLSTGELCVTTFNDRAREIKVDNPNSYVGWQQAFKTIKAGGRTSIGSGLEVGISNGYMPEKIVVITDGGENQRPYLYDVLSIFMVRSQVDPHIVTIFVDSNEKYRNHYTNSISPLGLQHDAYIFDGDYYLFDQVVAALGGPKAKSMVDMIMEIELPRRVR